MKRVTKLSTLFFVAFSLCVAGFASGAETEKDNRINWKTYGENLSLALRSENLGLQRSALQTIILKGDKIELGSGIVDLMNVYLTHENEGFRQLALVAIHKTQNEWAIQYLKANRAQEKSKKLRRLIALIVSDYEQAS